MINIFYDISGFVWTGAINLVPEGLGNCSFDLPAELCSDESATKRNLSLTFKKKAMYSVLKNRNSGTRISTDTKRTWHSVHIIRVSVLSG